MRKRSKVKKYRSPSQQGRRITSSHGVTYQGFNEKDELDILQSIVLREAALDGLVEDLCDIEAENLIEVMKKLARLREITLQTVELIANWRTKLVRPLPYIWNDKNYILRLASDQDFIFRSRKVIQAFDLNLGRRNPFFTLGGLDKAFFWSEPKEIRQHWSYEADGTATLLERIRQAETFIQCEEMMRGALPSQHEDRLNIILRKELDQVKLKQLKSR